MRKLAPFWIHLLAVVLTLAIGLAEGLVGTLGWLGAPARHYALEALGVHGVALVHLALVPLVPALAGHLYLRDLTGRDQTVLPRISKLAALLHVSAVVTLGVAVVTRATGPGYLLAAEPERGGIAWLGTTLAIMSVSNLLGAIAMLATLRGSKAGLAGALGLAAAAQLFTAPILLAALAWIWGERTFGLGVVASGAGGDSLLLPRLTALAISPAIAGAIAGGLGLVDHLLGGDGKRTTRAGLLFVVGTTLGAISSGAIPESEHGMLIGSAFRLASVALIPSVVAGWVGRLRFLPKRDPARLFAIGSALLTAAWLPTTVALEVPSVGAYLSVTTWSAAQLHLGAIGLVMVPTLAALHDRRAALTSTPADERLAFPAATAIVLGLLTFTASLVLLGARGMPRPLDPAIGSAALRAMAFIGSLSMAGGLLAAVASLLLPASRDTVATHPNQERESNHV